MGKMKVGIRNVMILDILRQEVTREVAGNIREFALRNRYETVLDIKGRNEKMERYELDRRTIETPFLVVEEVNKVFTVHGRLRGIHAEMFKEKFCDE